MAQQTETHRLLVTQLVSDISLNGDGHVSHAAGIGTYPEPTAVGHEHEPDVLARTSAGALIIGEAKQGDDLFTEHSQEQLLDFSTYKETGGMPESEFWLAVPTGWTAEALRAGSEAGGSPERTRVTEFDAPDAPPPPG